MHSKSENCLGCKDLLGIFFGVPLVIGFLYILWAITVALG
jgi:hypothetical protein